MWGAARTRQGRVLRGPDRGLRRSHAAEDLQRDIAAEVERLLASMRNLSKQEAMDQVYRKMTLYLCTACYQRWIEHPVG